MDKIESSPKTNSTHKWSNLFIIIGMVQFVAVGVLTVIFVLSHMSPEPVLSTIMTYTDAEFTPGLWFTFGYQMYIMGSIGVLVFGFVYRHIENMSGNTYNKKNKLSCWITSCYDECRTCHLDIHIHDCRMDNWHCNGR